MGFSLCDRNGLWAQNFSQKLYFSGRFSIPRRPTFGVALGVKKVNQSWVFGLRTRSGGEVNCLLKAEASNRSVDGNLFQKQLEFKPSFEEYLKDMESVRTDREKQQTLNAQRYKSNNEENINLGDTERNADCQIDSKGRGRELKGVKKMGFEENGNSGNSRNLVGDQLDGKGSKVDAGFSRKLNMDSVNRRWEKGRTRSVQKSKRSGELKGVKKLGFEEKANSGVPHNLVQYNLDGKERKFDVGINRKMDMGSKNERWVKRKDTSAHESKRSGELKGVKKIGFEENANSGVPHNLVQYNLDGKERKSDVGINRWDMGSENGRWAKRKDTSVQESKRSGELKDVKKIGFEEKVNSGISHNLVQYKLDGKERKSDVGDNKWDVDSDNRRWVKRKDTSKEESRRSGEFQRYIFKTNEGSSRGTLMQLERNSSQDGKRSVQSVKFRRSNKPRLETSNDEEVELERSAFKSLAGFDDVVDKPRISRNVMEERIQTLARCLNGADIDMPEWMFSKMMRNAQIRFSDHAMLRIIQILGKLGNWRRVLQLIEWLQLRDRFKSYKIRNIQTTALAVLGKARRPVEALNLFRAMQQHMSTYPDLVAYHCIAVTLGQAGHMKELFEVIDSMQSPPKKKFKNDILEKWDPRLEPDIVVYNGVLNACVQRKQWEGAFWVIQKLKEQHQRPSSTTYGLVMEVMFVCGKYNLVHDFFNKVMKSSIPNALTYKVMVNTLWKEGKTDEAVSAVKSMERRGIVGSAALYYDLARCLCSVGRCQEALIQIDKICKVANKPLVVTYTGLIQACLDAGNIQNGAYIFNHMHKFCSPNSVTCNIMLRAYTEHAMFEEAKGLFQKMLEDSNRGSNQAGYRERVVPDVYTFNTMLDACVRQQRWDDLEFVYKQMLHYGYHFNAKRHLTMILEASRVGKTELLETTWKHLAHAGQTSPPLLAKEMFCMKLEQGDHGAALFSISNPHFSEAQVFSHNSWLNFFREHARRFQKDSLVRLVHECSTVMSRSDSRNLVFQNLVTSCREFLENHTAVSEMYSSTNSQQTLLRQL